MVILGANGDLTARKLVPALASLAGQGRLPQGFSLVGVARRPKTDEIFRSELRELLPEPQRAGFDLLAPRVHYVQADVTEPGDAKTLAGRLAQLEPRPVARLFYLSLKSELFERAVANLAQQGLVARRDEGAWRRVIVEKPFGRDLASARQLNRSLQGWLREDQILRIDHYLGKETVQNLLVLRFANSIFEPIWNRQHIHHVQITAAETVGVEHRAGYYEQAGVVRDMFQNHLLQLVALTAMEPPVAFRAEEVRDEKAKVLRAVRPIVPASVDESAVRGQYGPGTIDGTQVPGYREEPRVSGSSGTPTYAAVRFLVDNWRWQGVPFYVRSGKRLARRVSEIAIQFRRPPHLMFPAEAGQSLAPNVLTIRIQPYEGISLCFEIKMPGADVRMTSVQMDFGYAGAFGATDHSAYETLLLDAMVGDGTLFARSDQVEAAWALVDPIVEAWDARGPEDFPNYAAGTWGPAAADALMSRDGCRWRTP